MFLRQLRSIAAGLAVVAAVCAAPAQSKADVQILIEELDGSNNPIAGLSQYTTLSGSGVASFTGSYFTGLVTVSTNSASMSSTASLTPSFSGQLTSAYDKAQDHKLRITVTDDGFVANGPLGTLKVEASGSTGFASGAESVSEDTRIYNPALANSTPINPPPASGKIPASSTTLLADGQTIGTPISLFTADGDKETGQSGVTGLTSPFAIQQTIVVAFSGDIPANATFGATGGASVTSAAAVPAPGGLALALIALPVLGLRRKFRTRAAA